MKNEKLICKNPKCPLKEHNFIIKNMQLLTKEQLMCCYDRVAVSFKQKEKELAEATSRAEALELDRAEAKKALQRLGDTCIEESRRANAAEARADALQKRLSDWDDNVKRVLEEPCAKDEKHCTCVPLLRTRAERAEARLEEANRRLACWVEKYKEYCEPEDFTQLDAIKFGPVGPEWPGGE